MKLRFVLFCLVAQSIFCTHGISQENLSTTNVVKKSENAVFMVYGQDAGKIFISQGSGFFISALGIGITNYHVLKGCKYAYIKTKDGKQYDIQNIVDYNNGFDLVKFKVNNLNKIVFTFLGITKVTPSVGESILNISNPLGLEQTVSTGIVSSIRELSPYGSLI